MRPVELTDVELGDTARGYVEAYLAEGSRLSRAIWDRIRGVVGAGVRFVAHVPPGTSQSRALRLSEGAILGATLMDRGGRGPPRPVPIPQSDWVIAEAGRQFCMQHGSGLLLFWNHMHRATDPHVRKSTQRSFHLANDVYYPVSCRDANKASIEGVMRAAMSMPHFLAAFVSPLDEELPPDRAEVPAALIDKIAARCQRLYLLAYDAEAYLSVEFAGTPDTLR